MSDIDNLDGTDESGTDESAVFAAIRKENRELAKKVAAFEAAQAEAEAAASTRRKEAASEVVNTLGLPGLAEDVLNWVEGDVTAEAVKEALEARSIPLPNGDQVVQIKEPEKKPAVNVSDVGQRVADAAADGDGRSLQERILAASSRQELDALMVESDLARSHGL